MVEEKEEVCSAGAALPHFKGSGDREAAPFQRRQQFSSRACVSMYVRAYVHDVTCMPIHRE